MRGRTAIEELQHTAKMGVLLGLSFYAFAAAAEIAIVVTRRVHWYLLGTELSTHSPPETVVVFMTAVGTFIAAAGVLVWSSVQVAKRTR